MCKKTYLIFLLTIFLFGCGGAKMDRGKAMEELVKIPLFSGIKKDIYVENVNNVGGKTLIEAKVRVVLSGEYKNKKFSPEEVRIGSGDWVTVSFFVNTLRDYRFLKTKENILKLSMGVVNFSIKNNKYPEANDITSLIDILHPEYIDKIVERDGWNRFLKYVPLKKGLGFKIISAGKDGVFNTGDDIIFKGGKFFVPDTSNSN